VNGAANMDQRDKRLRGKNWALFGILVAVGALLFAITIIRLGQQL
jgi:hypothetical protein